MKKPDRRHPFRLTHEAYIEPDHVVFITICGAQRRAILNSSLCAPIVIECVKRGCEIHSLDLVAYCVMPDHIHAVVYTKDGCDIEKYLRGLKWAVSRRLHQADIVGDIWQRSYWDRHHREEEDARAMIEYVLENPVRKGYCEKWEEWPHSEYVRYPGS